MTIVIGLWLNTAEEVAHTIIPIKTIQYSLADKVEFEPNLDHYTIVTGDYEPYVYTENGETKGFEYEIMVKILEEMEVDYEVQIMSWSRGVYALNSGSAFGIFPYFKTAEREEQYFFSDSLIDATNRKLYFYYYQKEDAPFELNSDEDLKQYKVGAIYGYYYTQIYDELGLEYDLSIDELECFRKLKEGRIQTVPIDPVVASALINRYFSEDMNAFKRSEFSFSEPSYGDHLMINKADPRAESFVVRFNQAFHKLKSSGQLDSYYDKN
ncbi:putative periplasmic binding protein [Fusibacter sp. 3D3]|nr:putative periplasmic binding protein [Fusibacter sp. 3D3]